MDNFHAIQKKILDNGLDAILISSRPNRRYVSGFSSSAGALVITADKAYFFTDSRYIEAASASVKGAVVRMTDVKHSQNDLISEVLSASGVQKLGIEEKAVSFEEYLQMKKAFSVELVPAQQILTDLRSVKTEEEVKNMIAAQRIAEKAFEDILKFIKPGVKEREIAAELNYKMMCYGADSNSFSTIAITGKKTSMPHGVPSDEKVAAGDFVTMDFGAQLNGYCSDMTRTVAVDHVTDEMKKVYNIVLEAQLAGIAAAKAGVSGREIDGAARQVISDAGYGECFGHSFGHSLGLEIHEEPNASPSNDKPMPAGAVISAEPGIYIPGQFGVRIEDVIVLNETGCKNITNSPKELIVL